MGRKPLPPTERKPRLTGAQRRKKQYEAEETAAATAAPPAAPKRGGRKNPPRGAEIGSSVGADFCAHPCEEGAQKSAAQPRGHFVSDGGHRVSTAAPVGEQAVSTGGHCV